MIDFIVELFTSKLSDKTLMRVKDVGIIVMCGVGIRYMWVAQSAIANPPEPLASSTSLRLDKHETEDRQTLQAVTSLTDSVNTFTKLVLQINHVLLEGKRADISWKGTDRG